MTVGSLTGLCASDLDVAVQNCDLSRMGSLVRFTGGTSLTGLVDKQIVAYQHSS